MTVKDIERYAKEKKMPKRGLDDMLQRLRAEYGENIDDMVYCHLCAYIDDHAEFWEGMRSFLKQHREERSQRKLR